MPRKKPQFVVNEIYHVILRGVGDTSIFKDEHDYFRAIFSVYEFNNSNPVDIWRRRQLRKQEKIQEKAFEGQTLKNYLQQLDKRDKFVEVLAFCFMPNHIHLLVRQLKESGISNFIQKVGGFATYFNKKYQRKGHLFNNFTSVHIQSDDQLKNVVTYIHTNPIALVQPGFKEFGVNNPKEIKEFLENYKWSSYQDYIGIKNFASLTERRYILEFMGGFEGCKADVDNWIMVKKEIRDFYNIFLE